MFEEPPRSKFLFFVSLCLAIPVITLFAAWTLMLLAMLLDGLGWIDVQGF